MAPDGLPGELIRSLPSTAALELHYLTADVDLKHPVTKDSVSNSPDLTAGPDRALFVYSLDAKPQLVAVLDSGMKVALLDTEATVKAVICSATDPQKGPLCYAVFDVPKEKAADLWKAGQTIQVIPKGF